MTILFIAYLSYASAASIEPPSTNTEGIATETKPENKDLEPQESWGFGYPRWGGYGFGGYRHGWGGYGYPRSYGWGYPRYYGGYGGWGYRGGFGWGGYGR